MEEDDDNAEEKQDYYQVEKIVDSKSVRGNEYRTILKIFILTDLIFMKSCTHFIVNLFNRSDWGLNFFIQKCKINYASSLIFKQNHASCNK